MIPGSLAAMNLFNFVRDGSISVNLPQSFPLNKAFIASFLTLRTRSCFTQNQASQRSDNNFIINQKKKGECA
jgi:hypothetical protein